MTRGLFVCSPRQQHISIIPIPTDFSPRSIFLISQLIKPGVYRCAINLWANFFKLCSHNRRLLWSRKQLLAKSFLLPRWMRATKSNLIRKCVVGRQGSWQQCQWMCWGNAGGNGAASWGKFNFWVTGNSYGNVLLRGKDVGVKQLKVQKKSLEINKLMKNGK